MSNPPWPSLNERPRPNIRNAYRRPSPPKRPNPFHKTTVLEGPRLPLPLSPTRSPDPPKAPSPSPLEEEEFFWGEGGGYSGKEALREGERYRGRVEGREIESSVGEAGKCDSGSLSNGIEIHAQNGPLQRQPILEHERTHAVRAALESLWTSEELKPGFGDTVYDGLTESLGNMELKDVMRKELEGREEQPKLRKEDPEHKRAWLEGTEEGKEGHTERLRREARVAPLRLPDRSASASSVGISDMVHRSQRQHHCILDGHLFTRRKAEKTEQSRRNQKTVNRVGGKWINCSRCGRRAVEEDSWVCEVEVCGMEACWECAKRWEVERRMRITESWLNTAKWEGYGVPRVR